ncbi:hypothetical protein O3P69_009326 [Scylla paramamosain]|uniref:Uncharacterized protein n=1 Tax=Scylla paramamosain TaxID=85552 RepID=A0AAW0TAW0_SCYPA
MGTKRSCLGVCANNGLIYCVGGYDGASCLNSVERYDPLTGTWTSCPAMATRRRYCRVALLEYTITYPFPPISLSLSLPTPSPRPDTIAAAAGGVKGGFLSAPEPRRA